MLPRKRAAGSLASAAGVFRRPLSLRPSCLFAETSRALVFNVLLPRTTWTSCPRSVRSDTAERTLGGFGEISTLRQISCLFLFDFQAKHLSERMTEFGKQTLTEFTGDRRSSEAAPPSPYRLSRNRFQMRAGKSSQKSDLFAVRRQQQPERLDMAAGCVSGRPPAGLPC